MTYKEVNLLYYLISIPVCIGICLFHEVLDQHLSIHLMSVIISAGYFLSYYCICKCREACSLVALFWLCVGVFGVSRFIMFSIGIFDYTSYVYSIFPIFKWEYSTSITVSSYYIIFQAIFSNFVIFEFKKNDSNGLNTDRSSSLIETIRKPTYILFFSSMPLVALANYRQAAVVAKLGYTSLYNGGLSSSFSAGIIVRLCVLLFSLAFFTIICFERNNYYFDIAAICYLLVTGIQLLQGSRAAFITSLLTIVFIRYALFGRKISFNWLFIGCVIGIPGLVVVSYIRNGISLSHFSIVDSYRTFFVELSGSLNVTAYFLQHYDELNQNTYPYIMDPIVRLFHYLSNMDIYKGGQSLDLIQIRYNLGHQITNNISTDYYLQGSNVASNFIAEMSEFGYIGLVFFSLVVTKLIILVEDLIRRGNPYFVFMSIEFCQKILMLPRSEAFYDTYSLAKYSLCFIAIYAIANILRYSNLGYSINSIETSKVYE